MHDEVVIIVLDESQGFWPLMLLILVSESICAVSIRAYRPLVNSVIVVVFELRASPRLAHAPSPRNFLPHGVWFEVGGGDH